MNAHSPALETYIASAPPAVVRAWAARGYTEEQIAAELARRAREARRAMFARIEASPRLLPAPNIPEEAALPPISPSAFKEAHAILDSVFDPIKNSAMLIRRIQSIVAEEFEVTRADILSRRRWSSVVRPRQLAEYLARVMTNRSLPDIGRRFGGRDHTTIISSIRKTEAAIAADPDFAARVARLRARIEGAE